MVSSIFASSVAFTFDQTTLDKHHANLRANLLHRLAIAEAQHNESLVRLLEQERQQLEQNWSAQPATKNPPFQAFTQLGQRVREAIARYFQLRVEQVRDEAGQLWWYAFDPRSGKTLYAEAETEVIRWIEENHLGR